MAEKIWSFACIAWKMSAAGNVMFGVAKQTVITAVNMNGDSDSVGCIAGAISGAYNGIKGIPPEWVQKIEKHDLLFKVARGLYDFRNE